MWSLSKEVKKSISKVVGGIIILFFLLITLLTFLVFIVVENTDRVIVGCVLTVEVILIMFAWIFLYLNKYHLNNNMNRIKLFFKTKNVLLILIGGFVLLYLTGFLLINNIYITSLLETFYRLPETARNELIGNFLFSVSGLALTVFILKYLLGMRHFKDAIKDVFTEIFIEKRSLNRLDKSDLLKIAQNITTANNDIEFTDKTNGNKSINKLKEHYYAIKDGEIHESESVKYPDGYDKNYIIIESDYATTLLTNNYEIMQRKLKCEVMDEGEFIFIYEFTAPSDNNKLKAELYQNGKQDNRFDKTSFHYIATSSITDDGMKISCELSDIDDNEGKKEGAEDWSNEPNWVRVMFKKNITVPGEVIDIDFSITHPFELTNRKLVNEYYETSYMYPHAVRHITFQLEDYYENKPKFNDLSPILRNGENKIIKGHFKRSVYYKTYYWEIFYNEEETRLIKIHVD